ncbi:methionyl-tRNA formyltransferase [Leeia oryzae]|uniref:methionyl-tRNA formyltransferase n=1 Tax=Leeia oryzae TaxID=356662 RepID=UPI00035CB8BD|nr:methionyl-tRNA formyltransferase [Leeia oryzae]
MRIIFAGTPVFAEKALQALINAGHEIILVLTQPDRPAGRGMKLTPSPVKTCALAHQIPVWQPLTLRDEQVQQDLRALNADVMVVAAYGLILPQVVLDIPKHGCLNIHASLLPRWRGAAPIHRAIEAGDRETGITIMQMEAGLDTGPMLSVYRTPIASTDTTASLHDKLAEQGGQAIVETLPRWVAGEITPVIQPEAGVNYAAKIDKAEAKLDWTLPADVLARKVRALNPAPGATTLLEGDVLKIWLADALEGQWPGTPGMVVIDDHQVLVICGQGALRLQEVQRAGAKRAPAAALLAGQQLSDGLLLGK